MPKGSIPESENVLEPVFRNGKLLRMHHFNDVRANAETAVPRSWYEDFARKVHAEKAEPVHA